MLICPYTRVATSPYGHVPHMPTVGIPLCTILWLAGWAAWLGWLASQTCRMPAWPGPSGF